MKIREVLELGRVGLQSREYVLLRETRRGGRRGHLQRGTQHAERRRATGAPVHHPVHQRLCVFSKVPSARAGDILWKILKESLAPRRRFFGVLRAPPPDPRRRVRPLEAIPRRIVVGDLVPEHNRDEKIGGDAKVDADGDENFTRDSLTGRRARSDLGGGQEKPPREPPPGHRSLRGEQLPE